VSTRSSVWITGIGAVSAAGANVRETLESFREGRRNPSDKVPFESSISCPTFQVNADLPVLAGRHNNSRTLRLATLALNEAMTDAQLATPSSPLPWYAGGGPGWGSSTIGVCIGTTVASQLNNIPFYDAYRRAQNPPLDAVYDYLNANLAQAIGAILNAQGPRMTIVNACSSGTDAIGVASAWIRAGLCDVAVAGGADELNRVALAGFWSLGVTSTQPCMPFDRDRTGLNLGEGAGILILESESHARSRGFFPKFEVAGFGAACDAHHLTAPHPEGRGLDAAIHAAFSQGSVAADKIAFVNAHGTATPDNDRAEGKVLARIFGQGVKFLSTKGYTGHTLGAAGGLEAVFTLMGLRERWLPASIGFASQPDDIPLAPIRQRANVTGDYALSTSLAFGGNNAAVLIQRIN
jgi:3-oxoacyl-[acyl-carrier-protein] synthase II